MHTQTKKLVGAIGATAAFTAALAHTGSTTLPLLGGAALLLAVGSGLALTKRRAINA